MVDGTGASRDKAYHEDRALKVIENLQKRKMNGFYAADKKEALSTVMSLIPPGAVVARGDSISLDQIGLLKAIKERNQNVLIDPFKTDEKGKWVDGVAERQQMLRETFFADIYITGTNAITLDGKLVNIDGIGNRVAAMIFGPARVILVAGVNKIVADVDAALERIRRLAGPLNVRRHYLEHHVEEFGDLPCLKTGTCAECRHEWRICNYTVIIDGAMPQNQGRINVVLVGEELGL